MEYFDAGLEDLSSTELALLLRTVSEPENVDYQQAYAKWLDYNGYESMSRRIRSSLKTGRAEQVSLSWARRIFRKELCFDLTIKGSIFGLNPSIRPAFFIMDDGLKLITNFYFANGCDRRPLEDIDVQYFCRSPHLERMRHLDLSHNAIGDKGCEFIAQCESMTGVAYLNLGDNLIGFRGAQSLAKSTSLKSLVQLDVSKNPIGTEGARLLAGSPQFPHLQAIGTSSHTLDCGNPLLISPAHVAAI